MRTFLSYIFTAIIGGAVAFCFFAQTQNSSKKLKVLHTDTVVIHRVDTVVKQHYVPEFVYIPSKTDTVKQTDTVFVVKDYFATRFYSDTLKCSSAVVYVQDSLRENRIFSRRWQCITEQESKIVTQTVAQKPLKKLGLGLSVVYAEQKLRPGVAVSLRTRCNHSVTFVASKRNLAASWVWYCW